MSEIQIISKESHKTLSTTMESTTTIPTEPSVVLLKIPMNDISVIKKDGLNAIVFLKNGEKIVIQNFFNEENTLDNSLVIQAENGQSIWAKFKEVESDADADADADADTEAAAYVEEMPAAVPEVVEAPVSDVIFQPIDAVEPLLYHDAGLSPWLWAVPLVAGSIITAASDNGGKGGGKKDDIPPNAPEDVVIGNGDGFITPDEISNGKVDVVVILPETGVSVGDKVIVNGEEHTITADDLTAGQIKVPVTVPPEGQALEVEVSIKDPAGNTSSPVTETATVDTTAPATPAAPTSYVDNVGDIQNPASAAVTTDDRTPGLNIGGGLTDTPTLYVDGVAVDAVYDPLTGTLTPTEPLSPGEHQLSYTLTDAAGNESAQSPALTLTIDTTAPTLTITSSDLELGAGETSTITFQFSEDVAGFTASDVVVAGGTLSNFVQVDANTWTATFTQSGTAAPSISVANGTYSDAAGNAGIGDILDGTDGFIFNPTASDLIGAITIPEDVNGDGIINAEELDIDGVFEAQVALGADAVVGNVITVNGTTYTVTQADIDAGFITATIAVAADGEVAIRAEARDAAGNVDVADTTVQVITVDTTAPATPAAPTSYVDNVGAEQGVNLSGSTTDDRTPGLNIGGGLTDTPTLYVDGVAVDAVYDPLTGTLTPTEPLSEGEHELSYTLTDAAGNESAESPALTLTVDTSFIDASEIVSATEDTPLNVLATDPNGGGVSKSMLTLNEAIIDVKKRLSRKL